MSPADAPVPAPHAAHRRALRHAATWLCSLGLLLALAALLGPAAQAATPGQPPAAAAAGHVDRVEPPHWWVGMAEPRLQLMLHGPGIAAFTPRLPAPGAPGVQLLSSTRGSSANYLFIDLEIAADAKPGPITLELQQGAQRLALRYELRARAPGSAQRESFGPADAILNLVPDRFANGDPANDNRPGFPDPANRASDEHGRHGGDIQGIAQRLDYLRDLGYTAIWPTPLAENRQQRYSYHGYGITDLYRIDERFGSHADYLALVRAARQRGIKMIQDVVLNHIGLGHWWMADLPTPDWITHGGRFVPTQHHRTAVSDPYAAQVDRDDFTRGWFVREMPDLNHRNPLLATYLVQNTIWWIEEAELAGLRIDTYGYSDAAFLAEWSRRVLQEYPRMNIVGEEWSGNPVVVARWLRGSAIPAGGHRSHSASMMDFPLHEALRRALPMRDAQEGAKTLYTALVNDVLYPEPLKMVYFEGNHDVPRIWSVLGQDLALWKMAMVHVATMPRTPQFYYGTELLMDSPTVRDDGATRRGFPGGWAGDAVDAVSGRGLTAQQREAQDFLRRLLTWRRGTPVLHQGRMTHYAPEQGSYVWFRHDGRQRVLVAINLSNANLELDTARFAENMRADETGTDPLSGQRHRLQGKLPLAPRSVRVLQLD